MVKTLAKTLLAACAAGIITVGMSSCDKVSATGVLIGGTGVDDRVEMSYKYLQEGLIYSVEGDMSNEESYSFLVGADSHIADDTGRLAEMFSIGLEHGDLLYAHLGDLADTKADYYINTKKCVDDAKLNFAKKYLVQSEYDEDYWIDKENMEDSVKYDDIVFPFFPVVGNHDITHNGWALFSTIFKSSFYDFDVQVDEDGTVDHFIFLDSANGTFGRKQIDLIEDGVVDPDKKTRHVFVFTHTNFFRPSYTQFSSTFPREEMYYMMNKFNEWNCTFVFMGHVHKWDDRVFGGVHYLTLDSIGERNSPNPGNYLVRVTCHKDGRVEYETVKMNYVKK